MKQLQETPSERGKAATESYFAAANSGRGFVSFYGDVFEGARIRKRYIVKGGPGTGKSRFLKDVAAFAEGQGKTVSYFHCSSDPDSLDGIVIDGEIAMMDGTAPHTVEPTVPGARDELVNLGEFWDGERLALYYNEIVTLGALKQSAYRRAYRFLSAAMEVAAVNRELILPAVREEKMRAAAERLGRGIPTGKGYSVTPALSDAISMRGSVRLDTYEKQAKKLYVVDDFYGMGALFLRVMIEEGKKKNCAMQVSYQPLDPELPDAVLMRESGICFVLGDGGDREADGRVNMKRFLHGDRVSEVKSEYRINRRLRDALLTSATEALADAGRYHFDLERIYGSCMDFEALGKFTRSFCRKLR